MTIAATVEATPSKTRTVMPGYDSESFRIARGNRLAATEGSTTLLITHRLAGLEAVDEVIVLAEGRVVQRGSYGELAVADGPLREMRERENETEQLMAVR